MLGISFEIENKYDNYLYKILDDITSSFDNIMVNGEVFDKTSNMSYISDLSCYNKYKPKLYLQVCDSIFVSLYSFNDDVIFKAKSNAIKNHFDKIEDASYEKMYFI